MKKPLIILAILAGLLFFGLAHLGYWMDGAFARAGNTVGGYAGAACRTK